MGQEKTIKRLIMKKKTIVIKKIREISQKDISKIFNKKVHLYLQINKTHEIIKTFRTNKSAKIAASILNDSF